MRKTLGIVTVAILLGLGGAALANDSGENHQDNTNTTGFNPFMPEFSTPAPRGTAAYAQYRVDHAQHHVVKHQVKR